MTNHPDETSQSWSDPRYFVTTFIMPFGILVWAGCVIAPIAFSVHYVLSVHASVANKVADVAVSALVFFVSLYYSIGGFQIFFLELRERFIAHKVIYQEGVFWLKGYFFKEATFREDEVMKVEPVVVSERWFQKRLGTLLSRSTPFTIPKGKNVNLKISLHDGRVFYLPGEMGRPGQWKNEDVKEFRDFMEACAARANAPIVTQ